MPRTCACGCGGRHAGSSRNRITQMRRGGFGSNDRTGRPRERAERRQAEPETSEPSSDRLAALERVHERLDRCEVALDQEVERGGVVELRPRTLEPDQCRTARTQQPVQTRQEDRDFPTGLLEAFRRGIAPECALRQVSGFRDSSERNVERSGQGRSEDRPRASKTSSAATRLSAVPAIPMTKTVPDRLPPTF